jgi:enoyl-CoA hydratase/carnithine racemase
MMFELCEALKLTGMKVRRLILTGDESLCSWAISGIVDPAQLNMQKHGCLWMRVQQFQTPYCRASGYALGGGCELALA